ncbi:MAG: DUF1501 domain-containing protein [Planctomycetaceae bacterium]
MNTTQAHAEEHICQQMRRRAFLNRSGIGLGSAALGSLFGADASRAWGQESPSGMVAGLPGLPHLPPRVKRVIFLCMAGGPSHLETFDYKPKLEEISGQPMPESYTAGQPIAQLQGQELRAQGPLTKFRQYGEGGLYISDYFPWHAKMANEICVIKSLQTEQINHDPAHTFSEHGDGAIGTAFDGILDHLRAGRGNQSTPWVCRDDQRGRAESPADCLATMECRISAQQISGVEFNSTGDPVNYVSPPRGVPLPQQQQIIEAIGTLDRHRLEQVRIPSWKLASPPMKWPSKCRCPFPI